MICLLQRAQQIIVKEKIDIVHGHARIPSFLCGLLHKKMKFPFITTAHWVFKIKSDPAPDDGLGTVDSCGQQRY